MEPLAERMRPRTLDAYVGQKHIVGKGAVLRSMIDSGRIASFILWGPPGVGKTTLAQIIANKLETPFYTLSAVTSGVKDVREVIEKARQNRFFTTASPILFIDEIHRFSKSQQDSLLGAVEKGIVTLIGATTENPSFEVIRPLLSRCQLYVLKPLEREDLEELLHRAVTEDEELRKRTIVLQETDAMLRYSGGDARKLLNILELVVESEGSDRDGGQSVATESPRLRQRGRHALRYHLGFHQEYSWQRSRRCPVLAGKDDRRWRRSQIYRTETRHQCIGRCGPGQPQRAVAGQCRLRCCQQNRVARGKNPPGGSHCLSGYLAQEQLRLPRRRRGTGMRTQNGQPTRATTPAQRSHPTHEVAGLPRRL